MLAPFLIGLVGGQRAMMPLAAVAVAAARGVEPVSANLRAIKVHPLVAAGAVGMAVAEMAGDKMKSAPDRTVPIGLTARFLSSAVAGAALASGRRRWLGAAVGGSTAVVASYPGWWLRTAAMKRNGQAKTGFAEDAIVLLGALAILSALEIAEP